jgi:hypothetical protein
VSHLGGDYAIWIVVGALYVLDAARLLSPREFLLCQAGRGRFAPTLDEAPFTLAGRVLAFGPLLRPDRAVFVLRWGGHWADRVAVRAALDRLAEVSSALLLVRAVAIWSAAWLFVGGPALTFWLGPTLAIYATMAAVYPAAPVAGLVLWLARARLRLSRRRIVGLVAEALVCPPCLANLVRKVTLAQAVEVDGARLALAVLEGERRERFWERLQRRAEELINEAGQDDPEGQRLSSYMATARAAL